MAQEEKITSRILAQARADAEAALAAAQSKADELLASVSAKCAKQQEEASAAATREAEETAQRIARMSALDLRKDELQLKRALVEEAFAAAIERLEALPAEDASALYERLICEQASGGEAVCPAPSAAGYINAAFLARVSGRLAKDGRAELTLAAPAPGLKAGLLLMKDGAVTDLSPASLVRALQDGMEADVAAALYPSALYA